MGNGSGVLSAGHVGGTRGSGVVFSAADVLWISVECGDEKRWWSMCLDQGGVGEWIGFWLYQSCGNKGSVGRVSVFGLRWCGEWVGGLDQDLEGWGGVMSV